MSRKSPSGGASARACRRGHAGSCRSAAACPFEIGGASMMTRWLAWLGCGLAVTGLVMELASGFGYSHGWWGLRVALRYLFAYGGIVAAGGGVGGVVRGLDGQRGG